MRRNGTDAITDRVGKSGYVKTKPGPRGPAVSSRTSNAPGATCRQGGTGLCRLAIQPKRPDLAAALREQSQRALASVEHAKAVIAKIVGKQL